MGAMSRVAVVATSPATVIDDYRRVMHLAEYRQTLSADRDLILKLNLSWTKFFPACSTPPWQLDGVLSTLLGDGFRRERLTPAENKTVVTDPWRGARENGWLPVLERHGLTFTALSEVEWTSYRFRSPLLALDRLFPRGIEVPRMLIGRDVLHLPTMKTHGHSITTGAVKNAFGGLLKEFRHYGHKYIHEVLVDLLMMQRELHPAVFAVMDATIAGDGAGPRTMDPKPVNYLLASADSVALDAVAARMMGFDPLSIPYLRMAHERGLGCGDPTAVEVVGDDIASVNLGFRVRRSLVIYGDQFIRKGPLRRLERMLLRSPLAFWAPLASTAYHDWYWYPLRGRGIVRDFLQTDWGHLFGRYRSGDFTGAGAGWARSP